jgi:hypothetical protein
MTRLTADSAAFEAYGADRAERLRRVRFIAQLHAALWTTFGPEGRRQRREVQLTYHAPH